MDNKFSSIACNTIRIIGVSTASKVPVENAIEVVSFFFTIFSHILNIGLAGSLINNNDNKSAIVTTLPVSTSSISLLGVTLNSFPPIYAIIPDLSPDTVLQFSKLI